MVPFGALTARAERRSVHARSARGGQGRPPLHTKKASDVSPKYVECRKKSESRGIPGFFIGPGRCQGCIELWMRSCHGCQGRYTVPMNRRGATKEPTYDARLVSTGRLETALPLTMPALSAVREDRCSIIRGWGRGCGQRLGLSPAGSPPPIYHWMALIPHTPTGCCRLVD